MSGQVVGIVIGIALGVIWITLGFGAVLLCCSALCWGLLAGLSPASHRQPFMWATFCKICKDVVPLTRARPSWPKLISTQPLFVTRPPKS
jgi:hypothetical protein